MDRLAKLIMLISKWKISLSFKNKRGNHEYLFFSFLFIYDDAIVAPRWIPSFLAICGIANGRPFHDDADPWIWPTLLSWKDNSIVRRSLLHGIDQILPFACTWLALIVDSQSSIRFYSKKFNLSPCSPYPRRYFWWTFDVIINMGPLHYSINLHWFQIAMEKWNRADENEKNQFSISKKLT